MLVNFVFLPVCSAFILLYFYGTVSLDMLLSPLVVLIPLLVISPLVVLFVVLYSLNVTVCADSDDYLLILASTFSLLLSLIILSLSFLSSSDC